MITPNTLPYTRKSKAEGKGTFGARMKAERLRRGFRLQIFADKVGIDVSQITSYENRGVLPILKNAILIAQLLDCSIDYLCGLED